ncbi:MAG: hypothetical protein RRB13_07785 [bacterium]|nr:hypothetical protein [bacterium]
MKAIYLRCFTCLLLLLAQRAELFAHAQPQGLVEPNRKFQVLHLDRQEAQQLKQELSSQGHQILEGPQAQALYEKSLYAQAGQWDDGYAPQDYQEPAYAPEPQYQTGGVARLNWFSFNVFDDDNSAVLFILIGLVVVFAFVFYAAYYLARHGLYGDRGKGWFEFGVGAWAFGNQSEIGHMLATRIGLGQQEQVVGWGLGAEVGNINATLDLDPEQSTGGQIDLEGNYLIAGPRLTFNTRSGSRWLIELMAGTSEHPEVNQVAKALVGYRYQSRRGPYIGWSVGSLMVSLNNQLGYVRKQNPYNALFGLEMGLHF